ncbi:hypothetical protein DFH08DRAFT_720551, partial [Mycena albidolilacea]
HKIICAITSTGTCNGLFISIHDDFQAISWAEFLPRSDHIVMDTHPYLVLSSIAPIVTREVPTNVSGCWPCLAHNS